MSLTVCALIAIVVWIAGCVAGFLFAGTILLFVFSAMILAGWRDDWYEQNLGERRS